MNPTDQIAEEAAKKHYGGLPKGAREAARKMLAADIKSAIEKATEEYRACLKHLSWSNHGFKPDSCSFCEQARQLLDNPSRAAHRVEKGAAGASDDNCRKCGRPLGWFEPGLCDDCRKARASEPLHVLPNGEKSTNICYIAKPDDSGFSDVSQLVEYINRAVHAGKPKPLERCSSNPHYEAHFGDEPSYLERCRKDPDFRRGEVELMAKECGHAHAPTHCPYCKASFLPPKT